MTYKNGRDVYLEWRPEMLSPISIQIRLTHSLLCSPSPPSHPTRSHTQSPLPPYTVTHPVPPPTLHGHTPSPPSHPTRSHTQSPLPPYTVTHPVPPPTLHGHTPAHLAISATAFTAVSLVISFLSLSTKMGKQLDSSLFNMSPRLAMTCPLKERHRASVHYSIQCNPKLPQRTPSQNITRSASNATTRILSNFTL